MQEVTLKSSTIISLPRPRLRNRGFIREIVDTLILIVAMYTLVNLATGRYVVEGPSMQPNFQTGQVLIVSRVHYLLSNPQRGDIMVFHPPNQPFENSPYIKRVIGLPGDTIEILDAQVYVNGVLLEEPYINEPCRSTRCRNNSWTLSENEFFVMGDNRNHSSDSREFSSPVTRDHIIGAAFVRYWPVTDIGLVNKIAYPGDPVR